MPKGHRTGRQERPQWRLEVLEPHVELFFGLSLLPVSRSVIKIGYDPEVTRCSEPIFGLEGQMGLWICECPQDGPGGLKTGINTIVRFTKFIYEFLFLI